MLDLTWGSIAVYNENNIKYYLTRADKTNKND